jgi:hypothetical protein
VIRRALLIAAMVLSFGAASAAPKYFGAPDAPRLSVRAGVGGAARPGRWMPVDVTVAAAGSPVRGAVVVEWGAATARQDIDLSAESATRVTLLVRTIAATPGIRVSMIDSTGAVLATSDVPLTLLPVDDTATLCIGAVPASATCSAQIPETEAPANWRGFDLADSVLWNAPRHNAEAAAAFTMWQAVRWWQDSGAVDPVVAPFDMDSRLADRTSLGLLGFVLVLFLTTTVSVWWRAPLAVIIGVPLIAVAAGVAVVTRGSRDVDIQAATLVHEFQDAPQSLVLMRGEIEHPGAHRLELLPSADAASISMIQGQRSDSEALADGRAIYRNTAGRGVKQRFELNGVVAPSWLTVQQQAGAVVVENHAPFAMTSCEVRSDDRQQFGDINPRAVTRVPVSRVLADGDAIVCRLPPNWMSWSAKGASVATRGSAFLIFHVRSGNSAPPVAANASR